MLTSSLAAFVEPSFHFQYIFLVKILKICFNWRIVIYNIVIITIHQHESPTGIHVSSHPEPPFHLPPHPILLGCPKAPALVALLHASNLDWSSILHVIIYMLQCYSFQSYPIESKSLFFTSSILGCFPVLHNPLG